MAKPEVKEHNWEIGTAIEAIQKATVASVSTYEDATEVKEKIRKADDYVKKLEKYIK
jgi:hypothetical protein